jgi:hypothetical protein
MVAAFASQWLGDFETGIETSRLGFETTGHRIMIFNLIESLIGAGRFEEATAVIERESREDRTRVYGLVTVAAAQGDDQMTRTLLDQYESLGARPSGVMSAAARGGQRERANAIAGAIDATPFGYLILIRAVDNCFCGAPFEMEAVPDFAARIEDADLPWPPPSPINWPLKDW